MKSIDYPSNDKDMIFSYHRTLHEGPNYFMCYYKASACLRQDPKDAWRTLGVAKFTDKGKELKEWCLEMHQKYVLDKQEDVKPRSDTSFASEVLKEEEPNDNTKMVV